MTSLENVIGFGSPDKGFRATVVQSDVLVDGADQIGNAAKDTTRQSNRRDAAEEALDHVEPRGGWRSEVDLDALMLMRRMVVADQMQCRILRRLAIDLTEKLKPFSVATPLLALGDDLAVEHVACSEQGGRIVGLVVVRWSTRAPS